MSDGQTTERQSGDALSEAQLADCLKTLAQIRDLPADDARFLAVERAAAHLFKTAKKKRRLARRQQRAEHNRALGETTGRVQAYRDKVTLNAESEPPARGPTEPLRGTRDCYTCSQPYRHLHRFYHRLCPSCGDINWRERTARADLCGRRALVTGGRIKIGFELARMLLRDGAHVRITTRFPHDAMERFSACEDFAEFRERLVIDALDFRDLAGVMRWTERLRDEGEPLDILVNNAAQTVRRPAAYYQALTQQDHALLEGPVSLPAMPSGEPSEAVVSLFPAGELDEEGRQLDLRETNSWRANLADLDPVEVLEVQLVNAVVPTLLNSRLEALLRRSSFADRYIVNASAMEGVFAFSGKTTRHPHTNMAKAGLNMMTRTSAADYASHGIYMNSVDTGWVTQENPHPIKQSEEAKGFVPPLDVVDGAARLYAPIRKGIAGDVIFGRFLKDYGEHPW